MNFLTIFIITAVIIGISVLALSLRMLVKKNGRFPQTSIGHNKNMKNIGISCARHDELKKIRNEKCGDCQCG